MADRVGTEREWTEEAIVQWIRKELGEVYVGKKLLMAVEIDNDTIKEKIYDAVDTYNERLPAARKIQRPYVRNQNYIDLSDVVGIRGVLDVEHEHNKFYEFSHPSGESVGVPYNYEGIDLDNIVFQRNYYTDALIHTDSNFVWEYDAQDNKLSVANAPSWATSVVIEYTVNNSFDTIRPGDRLDLRKLAYALSAQVLGRIRGKYPDGVPGAGGTVRMNGAELLQEGVAEQIRVKEVWDNRMMYLLPTKGW